MLLTLLLAVATKGGGDVSAARPNIQPHELPFPVTAAVFGVRASVDDLRKQNPNPGAKEVNV